MGGTELRQNVILLPRWLSKTPRPDLVTIFFGFNDWSSGMRGKAFAAAQQDAIDRIRRATGGRADVLILTSCPTLENAATLAEMAASCREAARHKNAGMADVEAGFQSVPQAERASLYAADKVHLSLAGQELVAKSAVNAFDRAGH
jgi:lysophospholipase L1-like esterase